MTTISRNYIFFRVEQYSVALPSENVLKIISTPAPSQGGLVGMGIVQLQQHSIQILNLEKLLELEKTSRDAMALASTPEHCEAASQQQNPPFLIVMRNGSNEDLWGIAVDEPPELTNIPEHTLSPVPEEIRLPGALKWVSHITNYLSNGNYSEVSQTLLVLDLPALLAARKASINNPYTDS